MDDNTKQTVYCLIFFAVVLALFQVVVNIHFYSSSINEKERNISSINNKIKKIQSSIFSNFIKFNKK